MRPNDPRDCDQCGKEYVPKRAAANVAYCSRRCGELARKESGRQRESHLTRKFGITQADYDRMLGEQGGGCWICGAGPEQQSRYPTYLRVDHCHETGRVRGLLCEKHNLLLGRWDHDPVLLRRAADYLEKS